MESVVAAPNSGFYHPPMPTKQRSGASRGVRPGVTTPDGGRPPELPSRSTQVVNPHEETRPSSGRAPTQNQRGLDTGADEGDEHYSAGSSGSRNAGAETTTAGQEKSGAGDGNDGSGNEGTEVSQAVSTALNSNRNSSATLSDGTIVSRSSNGYVTVRDGDTMTVYRGDGSVRGVLVSNDDGGYRDVDGQGRDMRWAEDAYRKGHVWDFTRSPDQGVDVEHFNTDFREAQRSLTGLIKPAQETLGDIRNTIERLEGMRSKWAPYAGARIDHSGATTTVGEFLDAQIQKRKAELAGGQADYDQAITTDAQFKDAYAVAAAPLAGEARPTGRLIADIDVAVANLTELLRTTPNPMRRDFLHEQIAALTGRRAQLTRDYQSQGHLSAYYSGLELEDAGYVQVEPGTYSTPANTREYLLTDQRRVGAPGENNYTGEFGSTKDYLGPAMTPFQALNFARGQARADAAANMGAYDVVGAGGFETASATLPEAAYDVIAAGGFRASPDKESYAGNFSPWLDADGKQVATKAEATYRIEGTGNGARIVGLEPKRAGSQFGFGGYMRSAERHDEFTYGPLHGKHPSEVLGRSDQNLAQQEWVKQNQAGLRIDRWGNMESPDGSGHAFRQKDVVGVGDTGELIRFANSPNFALHASNARIKGVNPRWHL